MAAAAERDGSGCEVGVGRLSSSPFGTRTSKLERSNSDAAGYGIMLVLCIVLSLGCFVAYNLGQRSGAQNTHNACLAACWPEELYTTWGNTCYCQSRKVPRP